MQTTPTRAQIDMALKVVTDPAAFADMPALRAVAWATLKTARGQRMNQFRIGVMQRAQRALPVQTIAIRAGA